MSNLHDHDHTDFDDLYADCDGVDHGEIAHQEWLDKERAKKERPDHDDATIDSILDAHGCEIQPGAFGASAIAVVRRAQQGDLLDRQTVRACRDALREAGHAALADRLLSA